MTPVVDGWQHRPMHMGPWWPMAHVVKSAACQVGALEEHEGDVYVVAIGAVMALVVPIAF